MIPTVDVMNRLEPPPTHSGELWCKRFRMDLLDNRERAFFERAFPRFFEAPPEHPRRPEYEQYGFRFEEPYNLRRFSGGTILPRSRYSIECTPETGFSQQTLAMELLAYAATDRDFIPEVFDMTDPELGRLLAVLDSKTVARCAELRNRCLVVLERPLCVEPGVPLTANPFVLPYEVTSIQRNSILDLRERPAMRWLLTTLWETFPGTVFLDLGDDPEHGSSTHAAGPMPVMRFSGGIEGLEQLRKALQDPSAGEFGVRDCGLGGIPDHKYPLLNLLQYILNPGLGGTPIDDIIAELLIAMGVDCLIYPSARHDCGVYYDGEHVVANLGWDIVDFSEASLAQPGMSAFLVDRVGAYRNFAGHFEITSDPSAVGTYDPHGWHLHGLAAETRARVLRRLWETRLKRECVDFPLEGHVVFERTPWRSYTSGEKSRKPRAFRSWFDLRLALITGEVRLTSVTVDAPGTQAGTMLGEYMVTLSDQHDLWGNGVTATAYEEDDPFLVQQTPDGGGLICPACGDVAELSLERMQACLRCGFQE